MIVVCYPVGTGGHFIATLLVLLLKGIYPVILPNGSMHGNNGYRFYISIKDIEAWHNNDIVIVHESDIQAVAEIPAVAKIICISIGESHYDNQEKNFLEKNMEDQWSENYYSGFKSDSYPPYHADLSSMPDWVIQDILKINRQYITSWHYIFPKNKSNILEIDFSEILHSDSLVQKIKLFLDIDTIDQSVYDLVDNYRKFQSRQ